MASRSADISLVRLLAALASGGLIALAFPKTDLTPLALVGLIPLRLALTGLSFRRGLALGLAYGLAGGFGLLYWLVNVMTTFGGLGGVTAGAILTLLVVFLALWPAVWAGCLAWLTGRSGGSTVLFGGLLWVGLEWVRRWFMTGFPWCDLGYALTPWPWAVQLADLGGVGLASLLIVTTNLALAEVILRPRRLVPIAVVILAWAVALGYGGWRLDRIDALAQEAPQVNVRVVQGNVDQNVKWDREFLKRQIDAYQSLSLMPGPLRPDLVVWPETAMTFYFRDGLAETDRLIDLAKRLRAWLLFGAPARVRDRDGRTVFYNRAYLLDPHGRRAGHFDKAHLIPYGEYVPLKDLTPFLRTVVEQVGDYSAGPPGRTLKTDFGRVGVLVCYESIFPELARRHARNGAGILVNITNDSWFGDSSAPYQHLMMLTWRAVETRRAIGRAAQTGISALIGPDGRIIRRLPLDRPGQLTGPLPILRESTIYLAGGHYLSPAALVLAGLLAAFYRRRTTKESNL